MTIFDDLKFFGREEAWGDPNRMNHSFLLALDAYRGLVNHPFLVTCGFEMGGHAPHSWHYKGRAVDGRFFHRDTGKDSGHERNQCI